MQYVRSICETTSVVGHAFVMGLETSLRKDFADELVGTDTGAKGFHSTLGRIQILGT